MPTGPEGERRPADVMGNAVKVMRITTGEEPEDYGQEDTKDQAALALGKKGGAAGQDTRAARRDREGGRCRKMEKGKYHGNLVIYDII